MLRASAIVRDAVLALRQLGLARTLAGISEYARDTMLKLARGDEDEALARDDFDAAHGTDTTSLIAPGAALGAFVATSKRPIHGYQSTKEHVVSAPLEQLAIRFEDFCFVDVGCGKGKPLLVASRFPFKRLVGVDISPTCVAIARRDLAACASWCDERRFEIVCEDAETFDFPPEPLVVYLFNPFPREVLATVIGRLEASIRAAPRPVVIFYVNALFADVLDASPIFGRVPSIGEFTGAFATKPVSWAWPHERPSSGSVPRAPAPR